MMDLSSIEKADVLRGITKEDLAELGAIASEQEFARSDRLFRRGEEARDFYITTRGQFALTVGLRYLDGYVEMAVEEIGALDAFGWSSLVEPRTSIYSGYCIEAGAVVAFPRKRLEALLTSNRRLGEEFLHNLNELIGTRVRALQQLWLDEVSLTTARVRYWTHTEITNHWATAMDPDSGRPVRHWIREHTHLGTED